MTHRRLRWWLERCSTFVVRPLIVVFAVLFIVWGTEAARHASAAGWDVVRDSGSSPYQQAVQEWDSIHRQLRDQVPSGTRLILGEAEGRLGWRARIVEFAIMEDIVMVTERDDADAEITVVVDERVDPAPRLVVLWLR